MKVSVYLISSILIVIGSSVMSLVSFVKGGNKRLTRVWGYFCLLCVFWGAGGCIVALAKNQSTAYLGWQVSYVGAIFLPVLWYHFIYDFVQLKQKILLRTVYVLAAVFLAITIVCRKLMFGELHTVFNEFYCFTLSSQNRIVFLLFYIGFHWILLMYSAAYLLRSYFLSVGVRRNQIKYLLVASVGGFLGGHLFFLVVFGVNLYPYANYLIAVYPLIIGYAINRYRLLDINIIITRTGAFVAVYSIVLGIPFVLAFGLRDKLINLLGGSWWMVPLITSTVLATMGPFIYLYIQQRAEDRLFQEQRRYQATLRQASTGMGKIKDLKKLVTLIVHIMTRTVRVEYSMVFLNDPHYKVFRLGAFRSRQIRAKYRGDIGYDTAIVRMLLETQNPIVYEEVKQRAEDYEDLKLARLEAELKALNAAIVVPSFVDEKLLAILVMGSKVSGKIYSADDLAVFSILANQSALAIENAQFYEDMKLTTAQLMKAEKMATIGIMADGLSHQINNRLHAMGFIAGDALDTLKIKNNLPMSLEVKEVMLDMEHALNRIESNVQQGGEIVQGLLKYTRKGEEGMTQVALDKLVAAALEMTQFKIKPGELIVNQDFSKDVPKIHGNFTQLQEVFFNMIDNAYDAMMQRKSELKEPNYAPTIKITAKAGSGRNLEIVFEDNGIGIRDEDKEKIFTPFFTTKLSSKKGTGLGLYVIQRLIEENHKGTVKYESKFKQGTKVYISLPT